MNDKEWNSQGTKDDSLKNREPGFDRIPDPDPETPAAIDMVEDAVGKGIDTLRDDLTGRHAKDAKKHK